MFQTPVQIFLLIFGILGALTTILCFVPQTIKTVISRDTSGLSKWFFIIALTSSFFWLCIGSLNIVNANTEGNIANGLYAGLPLLITNVISVSLNVTTLFFKMQNIKKAAAQNLSEEEYCSIISKDRIRNSKLIKKL